jgi:acetylornithine deacetylase/succinyl-diaminopimelate desuccinylase-like protein
MSDAAAIASAPPKLGEGAVRLASELIRIDTVNPPGNERPAQEMLAGALTDAGWECELAAAEPARPNLVARLEGESDGPTLAMIGHVDTVPADPDDWARDPWSGAVHDGELWGRGAQDMKGQVAAEVAACIELAQSGWRPARGELKLVITADEEMGAGLGARWLCEQKPELVRAELVVNEGGGPSFELGGRRIYTISVGEKGVFRFVLRTRGRAGHASVPGLGDNALLKLAPLLERLREGLLGDGTPEAARFISAVLAEEVPPEGPALTEGLERLREAEPMLATFLAEPMMGITLVPTTARAGQKDNVIPSSAEVLVDCRVPPGMEEAAVRERVRSLLGEEVEVELDHPIVGNRSEEHGELADAIRDWLATADPGAELAPIVMPGFSDSHWFRKAFGSVVYGFCPARAMGVLEAAPLVHAADERVPVADLELAASFFHDLPQRVLG